ncbi:periplasmic heavy metal sensor [bacterium]|nr:periplasmic heavy metal sensor [bacterium]
MKRRILAGTLLAATIAGGSGAWGAAEESHADGMAEGPARGPCGKMPHGDHLDRLAKLLWPSETQQNQIKAILKSEHEQNAALREKMGEYREQLQAAEQAATFNEAAVRAIAARQAQTEIELTVSRARTQQRINAVLTAEQRTLRQNLLPPMGPGPGHPPPFPGER